MASVQGPGTRQRLGGALYSRPFLGGSFCLALDSEKQVSKPPRLWVELSFL